MKKFSIFSICFFVLVFFSPYLSSAENPSSRDQTIDATLRDSAIDAAFNNAEESETPPDKNSYLPSRIRLFAGGATHGRSIFYIDYILPIYYSWDQNNLVFFNPKEHLEGPFQEETNLGLGLRRIFLDRFILGVNYFYDKSYSLNRKLYSQNGGGLELLSEPLDLRFNYYKPITKAKVVDTTYRFASMGLLQVDSMEEPLEGFDFEVGGPVFDKYTKTRFYAGGFFYNSKLSKDLRGVRFRTETSLSNWLAIDNILDSSENGRIDITSGIRVNLPFEWGRLRQAANPFESAPATSYINDRIFERVVRDLDVRSCSSPKISVERSLTYVDNSNTNPAPDGTFDNPYTTIADAVTHVASDKWIYVKQGLSQDPVPAYYSGDLTLPSDIVLWGSGYDAGYMGLSVSGVYPVINGGTNAITINNNNTVMGLQIQNAAEDGIKFTNGITLTGTIRNNRILFNGLDGVDGYANTGNMTAFDISNNTINGNGFDGIDLADNSGVMSGFVISGNTINDTVIKSGLDLSGNTGTMSGFIVSNNTLNNNDTGITIDTNCGNISDFTISGNTANNNFYRGIEISNSSVAGQYGAFSGFTISNNTTDNNGNDGLTLYAYLSSISDFTVSGNFMNNNGNQGIYLGAWFWMGHTGSLSGITFSRNTVTGNSNNGIHLIGTDGAIMSGINFGDGTTGGNNSIYGNNTSNGGFYDMYNSSGIDALPAEYNWWGTAVPQASQFGGSNATDYNHPLASNPN